LPIVWGLRPVGLRIAASSVGPRVVSMVIGGIYVDALRYADGAMGAGLDLAVV
jgi:hypothetical protein